MKKFIISLLFTAFFGLSAHAQLASIQVEDHSGAKFDTKTLADGKTPAIISFWSVNCKPCIQELDAINELFDEWKEQLDFRVVAVSTDDTRFLARAKSLTDSHGWDAFILLFDVNSDFKRAMNVVQTPQLFIINPNGKVVYSHTGYNPGSEEDLLEELKKAAETTKK